MEHENACDGPDCDTCSEHRATLQDRQRELGDFCPDFCASSLAPQRHKHCDTQLLLFAQGSRDSVPVPARPQLNHSKLL